MDIVIGDENKEMFALNTGIEYRGISRLRDGYIPELSAEDMLRATSAEWTPVETAKPPQRKMVLCCVKEERTQAELYEIAFYDPEARRFCCVMRGGSPAFMADNYKVVSWKDVIRRN